MKGIFLTLLFSTLYMLSFTQTPSKDVTMLRDHILNGIPDKYKTESNERSSFQFADLNALGINGYLTDGSIYDENPEFSDYLNQILQLVIPEELKSDSVIQAYLIKEGSYNAFMTASGKTFINFGLFAHLEDESALASVLAHEAAHYYMKHSLDRFYKLESGALGTRINKKSLSRMSLFSINNEYESDKIGMQQLNNAGYDMDGMRRSMVVMKNLQQNALDRLSDTWEIKETSHPVSTKRIDRLNNYIEENKTGEGEKFIVSEQTFKRLKKFSQKMILEEQMNSFQYEACIETAFKFHLQNPADTDIMMYLIEAIRRMCYLNVDNWSKNFITNRYYIHKPKLQENMDSKKKMTNHIFESFPYQILNISEEDKKKLPGEFYWKTTPQFKTNEDAFNYFYEACTKLKNPEALFSVALSYEYAPELMNQYLDEYLTHEDGMYRDYALILRNGNPFKDLPEQTLTVFSEFDFYIKQGEDMITIRDEDKSQEFSLDSLYDNALKFEENKIPLVLKQLKDEDLDKYIFLKELELLSFIRTVSKGKVYLHLLDPRYYQIFLDFGVNEIEFVNCTFIELNKKQSDLESYKEAISTEHHDILNKEKSSKYLDVIITSVRMKENAAYKIRYGTFDNTLKYKNSSYSDFIRLLQSSFPSKEKIAFRQDVNYRTNQ